MCRSIPVTPTSPARKCCGSTESGRLPGVAMMVVLISRGGYATVTARYDRAAIAHPELFAQCLRQGFDEVLALAGDPRPRVVPVVVSRPRERLTQSDERIGGLFMSDEATLREPASCPVRWPRSWPARAGPKVGAFFDLDGTLVAGFTAVILTRERFRSRDMGVGELITMIAAGLNHQLGRMEFEDLIGKATEALRGRSLSAICSRSASGCSPRRSRSASIRRCANWCTRTWTAATPWCSVHRR